MLEEFDYDLLFKSKNLKSNWEYVKKILVIYKPRCLILDILLDELNANIKKCQINKKSR